MFTNISKSTKQSLCSLHAQSTQLIDPFQQPCDLGPPDPTFWLPRPRPANGTGQRSYVGEQVDRDLQAPELLKKPWGTARSPWYSGTFPTACQALSSFMQWRNVFLCLLNSGTIRLAYPLMSRILCGIIRGSEETQGVGLGNGALG